MLTVSRFSSTNIAKTNNCTQSFKYSQPMDTINLSFKGNVEDDFDENLDNPISDFFIKMKAKADSVQILKDSNDVKKKAFIDYRHASSILDGKIKRIASSLLSPDEQIRTKDGNTYLLETKQGKVKSVTSYTKNGINIQVTQIDVINSDGTKDIIVPNSENQVVMLRKGVKQIAPKSYLEECVYTFKNGILQNYYENSSKINDGVAKSKSETKHNIHNFKNGRLSYFIPKATYVGTDLHYDKKYIYENNKIKTYMIDVDVIRGEDEPRKRYDF